MGVGGVPSGCPDVQLLRNMWEERRGDWWQQSEMRILPRVGSLHYLCGHCGHTGHSLLVYDNITVRDGQDNDSWKYTTRIPQDCLVETSWKRSSRQILSDTGQQKEEQEEDEDQEMLGTNENRTPRLKMFKLKCLNKVASFSIFK